MPIVAICAKREVREAGWKRREVRQAVFGGEGS